MCEWIITWFNEFKLEIRVKLFLKCIISNKLDGTEDDYLWLNKKESMDKIHESDSADENDISENKNESNELFVLSAQID